MAMYSVLSMAHGVELHCSRLLLNFTGASVWKHSCTARAGGSAGTSAAHVSLLKRRNRRNGRSDRECGCRGTPNLGHTIERRNATLKPAEVLSVNESLLRSGFMVACPSLGLWMIDSNAGASELEHISSSALSEDVLLRFVSFLGDLDAGTAQLVTGFVGPFITLFNVLFIFRVIMSWYPGIPVKKFPFVLAYVPTEPVLGPTRRLIPPVGGVDVAPVIWVALMSFANEILLGKQGLLVLLSQQQS